MLPCSYLYDVGRDGGFFEALWSIKKCIGAILEAKCSSGKPLCHLRRHAAHPGRRLALDQRTRQTRTMGDYVDYTYDALGRWARKPEAPSGGRNNLRLARR